MDNIQHKTVIVANGQYPTHPIPLRLLQEATHVVCCDNVPPQLEGREIYAIVGDGDSLSNALKTHYADRFHHSADQETNDLTKAVQFCLQEGLTEMVIVGATGLREDHTVANISLLTTYPNVKMYTNYGYFTAIQETTRFSSFAGQQVSLFAMTAEVPISVDGLQYPIQNRCLRQWWEGSLNASLGDSFVVVPNGGKVIVYQTYDKKADCPTATATAEKEERYRTLLLQLEQLLHGETDMTAKMANTAALLHHTFHFWWTGFYRVEGNELLLAPFQGPLACMHIAYGRGVCGTAWQQQQSIVVPDVEQFAGHIACSSASRSEIVVPMLVNDKVVAVLDIDSEHLGTFDDTDRRWLERVVAMLQPAEKEICLAAGCFWGAEHFLQQIEGITFTEVGFANGNTDNPSYKEVYTDTTGFAEAVRLRYNTAKITLEEIIELYFKAIDPTSLNRQGDDEGTRYRTGIYYTSANDLPTIRRAVDAESAHHHKPLQVEVAPLRNFYRAEEEHQDYLNKNPQGYCHLPLALFEMAKQHRR